MVHQAYVRAMEFYVEELERFEVMAGVKPHHTLASGTSLLLKVAPLCAFSLSLSLSSAVMLSSVLFLCLCSINFCLLVLSLS